MHVNILPLSMCNCFLCQTVALLVLGLGCNPQIHFLSSNIFSVSLPQIQAIDSMHIAHMLACALVAKRETKHMFDTEGLGQYLCRQFSGLMKYCI